jgi:hypothetical protein
VDASLRIGLVDLDTSHPGSWVPRLRELSHQVVGVYDGGTVWQSGYAVRFAQEHNIPQVFDDLGAMANAVDVAIIHSCNWGLHTQRAEPFLRAGKGVMLDKPLVGNLRDAHQLLDWSAQGQRVFGGSSLRWTKEVAEYLAQPIEERGQVHTVLVGCAVDDFNYGIHAYALLHSIMGSGAERVRYLGTATQKLIQVTWRDNRIGMLSIGAQPGYLPLYATIVSDQTVRYVEPDVPQAYRRLLETTLPYLGGIVAQAPLSMRDLLEPELIALAAKNSWMHDGAPVLLSDLSLDDEGYDGAAFACEYRQMKQTGTENFRVY